ncbi:MAG: PorP/SprF family type IX secretion system membrane protein [Flavobacteriales bacterium]|nr:PorP/SprF family type IX secretion system membrane protein [Flavobacteriales bacterium]
MVKKLLFILFILGVLSKSKAQDVHLSMYDAAPLFLNPAMTGLFEGEWRLHGQYRTQWKAVNFKPYNTALISFDKSYKKWGFGGQITNLSAGIGNFNVLQGLVSASYSVPLDFNKYHNISLGIQGGITQKYLEYQLHTFDNQYTTLNGGGFNEDFSNGESFNTERFYLPALNAGVLYYHAKQQSFLNPFVGVSAFNLIKSKETFFDQDNSTENRYYLHLGSRVNLTELFYVLPKFLLMNQGNFNEQTYAIDIGYYLKGADLHLLGGFVYRNEDAFIVSIGAKKNSITGKVAYDINSSSLNSASTGRGAFEISITYIKNNKKNKNAKICPRL